MKPITNSVVAVALSAVLLSACHKSVSSQKSFTPTRDINTVLRAHDRELLAIPGVVGVYVGLMDDQKTQCLKVMLARNDPKVARQVPQTLEGHPVVTEVTGEIKPMGR